MARAYCTAERAEDMCACFEEAALSVMSAIDALKSVRDSTADEFAGALEDILGEIGMKSAEYSEIMAENEREEQAEMLRQFWRDAV